MEYPLARIEEGLELLAGARGGLPARGAIGTWLAPPRPSLEALTGEDDGTRAGVLVIDGAERLRGESEIAALAELIREPPDGITLAIASRSPLRIGLGRLRARQLVVDIDRVDLTMTSFEAYMVLQSNGLEVGESALEEIVDRTEGWPAAIQLAAHALRRESATAEAAAARLAQSALLPEYVREEVLSELGAETLADLRRLSISELMCGELGDAVLERGGAGHTLQELHDRGAMIVPQDTPGHWYRLHGLVRDVLRSELDLLEPELVRELHRRASGWFEERDMTDRALDHAAAGHDPERVGRLLWKELGRVMSGHEPRVERWLGEFSPAVRASDPALRLEGALKDLMHGAVSPALQTTRTADALIEADLDAAPAQRACVHAIEAAACREGVDRMAASAREAAKLAPQGPLHALAMLLLGVAEHLRGEHDGARTDLADAAAAGSETVPLVRAMALGQQALLDLEEGDWEQAGEHSHEASRTLALHGLELDPAGALAPAVAALVAIHRGYADEAKQSINAVSHLLEDLGDHMPWYEVEVLILTARASTRLGEISGARALLAQASRRARRAGPATRLVEWLDEAWGEVDEASARALAGQGALTIAELRVLRFLPSHLSFREIGERLNVSGNTVKTQTHAIYAKLGVTSRSDAVTRAAGLGLIDPAIL